jgi:hypothetical protein
MQIAFDSNSALGSISSWAEPLASCPAKNATLQDTEVTMTPDQIFETFRKTATSSWQMQQEMLKQYTQQWASFGTPGGSTDWSQLQKRWSEVSNEYMTKSRESLDATYKLVTQFMELAARVTESKNPDEYRAGLEEARTKMYDAIKDQSETSLREFQKTAEKWFEGVSKG